MFQLWMMFIAFESELLRKILVHKSACNITKSIVFLIYFEEHSQGGVNVFSVFHDFIHIQGRIEYNMLFMWKVERQADNVQLLSIEFEL
jgi:hypothetical protein